LYLRRAKILILIRISVVSYLNSRPFIDGLESSSVLDEAELSLDIPSQCAQKLIEGKAEIGLVPVAVLPLLKNPKIISDYCIGATGPVSSVMLYSDVPLGEIKKILLDYQSRTSVALVRILAANYWKINPEWVTTEEGFENRIKDQTAAVIIGDRTFGLSGKYRFEFDLAEQWISFSKLPFVFACWVSTKQLPVPFFEKFNTALAKGIGAIPKLAAQLNSSGRYNTDVLAYLTRHISYAFDPEKQKGLQKFLSLMTENRSF
jgi:chorismate dehydratase